jgi:tRNA dimethylallyltransferase
VHCGAISLGDLLLPGEDKSKSKGVVAVIAGPTASGKSGLGLALAKACNGVVINADAMQVYRDLSVLTARPTAAEMAAAPHRLYGVLDAAEFCSAKRWSDLARAEIEAALAAGRLPILVGGTGLYIKALREGLTPLPDVPAPVRAAAVARFDAMGGPAFHEALQARDPETAAGLHPNDRQRLIRAWEVLEASGLGLAAWRARKAKAEGRAQRAPDSPYRFETVAILPPRERVYASCDTRFLKMVEGGALAEVQALMARRLDPALPAMKSLGVPELRRHLLGEISLSDAIAAAQLNTRHYAKRQFTWLRHQVLGNDPACFVLNTQFSESLPDETFNKIRQKVLTAFP